MNKKGFTLVELLVVITVIGLLAAFAIVSLNSARVRARDGRRVSEIKQVQTALELYFNEKNTYPEGNGIILGVDKQKVLCSTGWEEKISDCGGGNIYMGKVPANQQPNGADYIYTKTVVGTDIEYSITFSLESDSGDLLAGPHTALPIGIN